MNIERSTIAIVGLGLIGASIGKSLSGKCACRIAVETVETGAIPIELIGEAVDEVRDEASALGDADIVVLAMPVADIVKWVQRAAQQMKSGAIVTDVGSTKRSIEHAMSSISPSSGVRGVGGHPMAGREVSGYRASTSTMFSNAQWAVVPSATSDDESITIVRELVRSIGAVPLLLDAESHDRIVALTSHSVFAMGHILLRMQRRYALHDERAQLLAGGGFRDATRLARGNADMWSDVVANNADVIAATLDDIAASALEMSATLRSGDQNRIQEAFSAENRT